MARTARLVVPYCPHHILHRGHNREPVFLRDADYRFYLDNLFALKRDFGCRLYAFCLMPNHVHLLLDPGANPENLGRLMKHLAGRQARYSNRVQRRSGAVWEGRFRSSPVAEDYVLPCSRYIELNPVRACLADRVQRYRWSSYLVHNEPDFPKIDFHPQYLMLGSDWEERSAVYQKYVCHPLQANEVNVLRRAIQSNRLTGGKSFGAVIEREMGLKFEVRGRGRPRKHFTSEAAR